MYYNIISNNSQKKTAKKALFLAALLSIGDVSAHHSLKAPPFVTVGLLKKPVCHVSDGSHYAFLLDKCGCLSLVHTDSEVFQQPHCPKLIAI